MNFGKTVRENRHQLTDDRFWDIYAKLFLCAIKIFWDYYCVSMFSQQGSCDLLRVHKFYLWHFLQEVQFWKGNERKYT